MYRRALATLLLWNLLFLAGYFCVLETDKSRKNVMGKEKSIYETVLDQSVIADQKSGVIGVAFASESLQRVVHYGFLCREKEVDEKPLYILGEDDYNILLRIVEAEAGGEDEDGKLLVANVVLNRMNHEKFPDTVSSVVLQKNGKKYQFSPVGSGRIWNVRISEETYRAVERALDGEDLSQGALFFAARKRAEKNSMRWFDTHLTFLFSHGGHEFFL